MQTYSAPPADKLHISNQIKTQQTVSLYGLLAELPSVINLPSGQQKTRLLMQVRSLQHGSGSDQGEQAYTKSSGLVLLTLQGLLQDKLKPGDHFIVKTKISPINTFSTPGSFNFKKHLNSRSIMLKGWINSPQNVIKVHTGIHSSLAARIKSALYYPEQIRYGIAAYIDSELSQPASGLYKAILIGDRSGIDPSVLEKFIRSGCIHILAISGMHMGLLSLIIIAVTTWFLKRSTWILLNTNAHKLAVGIAILPLAAYAFIAGFNIPVLRSLLMTTVLICAIIFDRPGNLLNHIALAALIILAWKPSSMFTASFQLSFSAVISIGLIYPLLCRFIIHASNFALAEANKPEQVQTTNIPITETRRNTAAVLLQWSLAGIAVTTAAMLGTLPLLLFHFNRVSLVAPFTNLLIEPLICFWSLILGIIACLFIPFVPAAAEFFFISGSLGLIISEKICGWFSAMSFSSLRLSTPSPLEITIYYIFLLSLVMTFHLKSTRKNLSLIIAIFSFCSLLATPAISKIVKYSSVSTSVSILDIGHGTSHLLQLPQNRNILLDGGGAGSESFDIGERVIAPFLWRNRLNRLDAVIISHPHADHYNGLPFILAHFQPKELWINGASEYDAEYQNLLDLARELDIRIKVPLSGEIMFQSGDARLQCIQNGARDGYLSDEDTHSNSTRKPDSNDMSLVLRLTTVYRSFLFPGDISSTMASVLVSRGRNLQADVLMAPHHGSRSSMNPDFIKTVDPEYLAISAGRNNPFNLPDISFYALQQNGIKVYSTGRDGTLTFTARNNELKLSRYQVN